MRLTGHIEGGNVLGSASMQEVGMGCLTIGRAADCGWMLNDPDRSLSKLHCHIDWTPGGYTLTDTSTNGVFINGARRPLGRDRTAALSDGDLLMVGPYRIRIAIEAAAPAEAPVQAPPFVRAEAEAWIGSLPSAGFGQGRPPVRMSWVAPPEPATLSATGISATGLPASSLFGSSPLELASDFIEQGEHAAATSVHMRLPVAQAVLPMDWDDPAQENPLGSLNATSPGAMPTSTGASPSAANPGAWHIEAVAAFLEGAGVAPDVFTGLDHAAVFRDIGRLVRASVLGMRDLLGTRKLAKAEFRMEPTVIQAAGNNAMKFSADAERALQAIIGQAPAGFLPGAEAMEQALQDVKSHELAMVATISVMLNEVAQLDPAAIRDRAGPGSALLAASRRARWWDEFERAFAKLQGDAPAEGQAPLLHRFAQAYAEQAARTSSRPS